MSSPSRYIALSVPPSGRALIGRSAHWGICAASRRRTSSGEAKTSSSCIFGIGSRLGRNGGGPPGPPPFLPHCRCVRCRSLVLVEQLQGDPVMPLVAAIAEIDVDDTGVEDKAAIDKRLRLWILSADRHVDEQ